jgi:hypothetical protein
VERILADIARCDREIDRIAKEPDIYPAWLLAMATSDWEAEKQILMQEMHTFASGAKSTVEKPRYDLVPAEAVQYIAERFAFGASRHGERNWEKGVNDAAFFRDRKNHGFEHYMNYLCTGDVEELKAAICNMAMLAAIEERRTKS